jgi:hypothetical protein
MVLSRRVLTELLIPIPSLLSSYDLKEAFWLCWTKPRRDALTEVLQRGVAAGEFRKGLDLDIVIDGLYGPIYYRLLVPYADLSNSYVESLATNLLRGIAFK